MPAKKKFNWQRPETWSFGSLATLGPVGFFPKGSGTVGALIALPIAYFASHISIYLLWAVTLCFFGAGLFAIQQFTADKAEKDPSCVIVDEVAGQLVTFLVVIPQLMHWPMLLLGFALFLFFTAEYSTLNIASSLSSFLLGASFFKQPQLFVRPLLNNSPLTIFSFPQSHSHL